MIIIWNIVNINCSATVTNLQAKVSSLTTTNALLKEDLAIARNSFLALQAENQLLKQNAPPTTSRLLRKPSFQNNLELEFIFNGNWYGFVEASTVIVSNAAEKSSNANEKISIDTLKNELQQESEKRVAVEKELKLQVSLKAETDVAMKLMEKHLRDKEDTITSLRLQLDQIKQINLEMYRKLQVRIIYLICFIIYFI